MKQCSEATVNAVVTQRPMGRATTEAAVTPPDAPADMTGTCLAGPHREAVCMASALTSSAPSPRRRLRLPVLRLGVGIAMIGLLAACAGHNPRLSAAQQAIQYKDNARGDYTPPGPPSDPWGPYVFEASRRFDVPQSWIRNVMHTESGGQLYINGQLVTSGVGAMGLMQVMPETYQELEAEYGLGDDPYNPHDNIMAGTAYLREMYDLFGSPGFLAAYNAGPQRLNQYLTDGRPLPSETTHYVAMIEPYIQGDMPTGRSPADQFAMNSLNAPSGQAYNGGANIGAGESLAETGGGLVSGGSGATLAETGGGLVTGGDTHGGGSSALMAMNQPVTDGTDGSSDAATDALNGQQVADHSAALVAAGGGAVPADLMVATNEPRSSLAQVNQEEVASDAAVAPSSTTVATPVQQQRLSYQPAVVEQTPVAAASAAPLPAARSVFQVAPAYQPSYAPAAAVPAGTRIAQNNIPPPPPPAPYAMAAYSPTPRRTYSASKVIGPGGMQNLAMEAQEPPTSYQPRASGGLHLIAPAEAETLPLYAGSVRTGGWGIQVGAYGRPGDARQAAETARHHERYQLASARMIVMPVHVSQRLLYRARLSGLSENAAVNACQAIRGRSPCMVLSPDALGE